MNPKLSIGSNMYNYHSVSLKFYYVSSQKPIYIFPLIRSGNKKKKSETTLKI